MPSLPAKVNRGIYLKWKKWQSVFELRLPFMVPDLANNVK